VLAEAGEVISRARAMELEDAGVTVAFVTVEDHGEEREVKIVSNGMVDIHKYVDFDCTELGINERVRYSVLREILDSGVTGDELKEAIRSRAGELVSNHILIDDILASINYVCCLGHDIGTVDDIDHSATGVSARGRAAAEPVPHRLLPYGEGYPRAHDPAGAGYGRHHPAGAHQHPSGGRRDQGVFRFLASCRSSWIRPTPSRS